MVGMKFLDSLIQFRSNSCIAMLEIEVMHLIGVQDYFVFLKVKFIFIGLLPEFEFEFSLLNRFAMYERRHKI